MLDKFFELVGKDPQPLSVSLEDMELSEDEVEIVYRHLRSFCNRVDRLYNNSSTLPFIGYTTLQEGVPGGYRLIWNNQKFHKRFRDWLKKYYNELGFDLVTGSFMSENFDLAGLGSYLFDNKTNGHEGLYYDIVKQFDWYDGDFGDDGSCFWGERAIVREVMESTGFLAFRLYEYDEYSRKYQGVARMWLYPDKEEDCVFCFNGYGYKSSQLAVHLSNILGATFNTCYISCDYDEDNLLYFNGDGIQIRASNAHKCNNYSISESSFKNYKCCYSCDEYRDVRRGGAYDGDQWYCDDCASNYLNFCDRCEKYKDSSNDVEVRYGTENWCDDCLYNHATDCARCNDSISQTIVKESSDGDTYCPSCFSKYVNKCSVCGTETEEVKDNNIYGEFLCDSCIDEKEDEDADD